MGRGVACLYCFAAAEVGRGKVSDDLRRQAGQEDTQCHGLLSGAQQREPSEPERATGASSPARRRDGRARCFGGEGYALLHRRSGR